MKKELARNPIDGDGGRSAKQEQTEREGEAQVAVDQNPGQWKTLQADW